MDILQHSVRSRSTCLVVAAPPAGGLQVHSSSFPSPKATAASACLHDQHSPDSQVVTPHHFQLQLKEADAQVYSVTSLSESLLVLQLESIQVSHSDPHLCLPVSQWSMS